MEIPVFAYCRRRCLDGSRGRVWAARCKGLWVIPFASAMTDAGELAAQRGRGNVRLGIAGGVGDGLVEMLPWAIEVGVGLGGPVAVWGEYRQWLNPSIGANW